MEQLLKEGVSAVLKKPLEDAVMKQALSDAKSQLLNVPTEKVEPALESKGSASQTETPSQGAPGKVSNTQAGVINDQEKSQLRMGTTIAEIHPPGSAKCSSCPKSEGNLSKKPRISPQSNHQTESLDEIQPEIGPVLSPSQTTNEELAKEGLFQIKFDDDQSFLRKRLLMPPKEKGIGDLWIQGIKSMDKIIKNTEPQEIWRAVNDLGIQPSHSLFTQENDETVFLKTDDHQSEDKTGQTTVNEASFTSPRGPISGNYGDHRDQKDRELFGLFQLWLQGIRDGKEILDSNPVEVFEEFAKDYREKNKETETGNRQSASTEGTLSRNTKNVKKEQPVQGRQPFTEHSARHTLTNPEGFGYVKDFGFPQPIPKSPVKKLQTKISAFFSRKSEKMEQTPFPFSKNIQKPEASSAAVGHHRHTLKETDERKSNIKEKGQNWKTKLHTFLPVVGKGKIKQESAAGKSPETKFSHEFVLTENNLKDLLLIRTEDVKKFVEICKIQGIPEEALVYQRPKELTVQIPWDQWKKAYDPLQRDKLKEGYADVIDEALATQDFPCSFSAKKSRVLRSGNEAFFLEGKCSGDCKTHYKGRVTLLANEGSGPDALIKFDLSGDFKLLQTKPTGRQVRGMKRDHYKQVLSNVSPYDVFTDKEKLIPSKRFLHNNHNQKNLAVVWKIKSEVKNADKKYGFVTKDLESAEEEMKSNPLFGSSLKAIPVGYIRTNSFEPFNILLCSSTQLQYALLCDTWYIDSTGQLVTNIGGKQTLVHSVIGKNSKDATASGIPLFEFILNANNSTNIKKNIEDALRHIRNVDSKYMVRHVVSDFCYANLHALSESLNCEKLDEYVNRLYDASMKEEQLPSNKTNINICRLHLINAFKRNLVKHGVSEGRRQFALHALTKIQEAKSTAELAEATTTFITLFGLQKIPEDVFNTLTHDLSFCSFQQPIKEESAAIYTLKKDEELREVVPEEDPDLQREKSKFFVYFNERENEIMTKDLGANCIDNPLYNPHIFNTMKNHYFPYVPLWSSMTHHLQEDKGDGLVLTTAPVEQYFWKLKNLLHKLRLAPATFVREHGVKIIGMINSELAKILNSIAQKGNSTQRLDAEEEEDDHYVNNILGKTKDIQAELDADSTTRQPEAQLPSNTEIDEKFPQQTEDAFPESEDTHDLTSSQQSKSQWAKRHTGKYGKSKVPFYQRRYSRSFYSGKTAVDTNNMRIQLEKLMSKERRKRKIDRNKKKKNVVPKTKKKTQGNKKNIKGDFKKNQATIQKEGSAPSEEPIHGKQDISNLEQNVGVAAVKEMSEISLEPRNFVPPSTVLTEVFSLGKAKGSEYNLATLRVPNWLDETAMDGVLNFIVGKYGQKPLADGLQLDYAVPSEALQKLERDKFASWHKSVDLLPSTEIFNHKEGTLYIPTCISSHWITALVQFDGGFIDIIDSKRGCIEKDMDSYRANLTDMLREKYGIPQESWMVIYKPVIQQSGGWECGYLDAMNVECFIKGGNLLKDVKLEEIMTFSLKAAHNLLTSGINGRALLENFDSGQGMYKTVDDILYALDERVKTRRLIQKQYVYVNQIQKHFRDYEEGKVPLSIETVESYQAFLESCQLAYEKSELSNTLTGNKRSYLTPDPRPLLKPFLSEEVNEPLTFEMRKDRMERIVNYHMKRDVFNKTELPQENVETGENIVRMKNFSTEDIRKAFPFVKAHLDQMLNTRPSASTMDEMRSFNKFVGPIEVPLKGPPQVLFNTLLRQEYLSRQKPKGADDFMQTYIMPEAHCRLFAHLNKISISQAKAELMGFIHKNPRRHNYSDVVE